MSDNCNLMFFYNFYTTTKYTSTIAVGRDIFYSIPHVHTIIIQPYLCLDSFSLKDKKGIVYPLSNSYRVVTSRKWKDIVYIEL